MPTVRREIVEEFEPGKGEDRLFPGEKSAIILYMKDCKSRGTVIMCLYP